MNNFDKAPTMVISAVKVIFLSVIYARHIIVLKLFMSTLGCTSVE
jgi:hypothetical protein